MRYIFDIETDGFLHTCTKVHCIVLKDIDSGEILTLDNESAIKKLETIVYKDQLPSVNEFLTINDELYLHNLKLKNDFLFPHNMFDISYQ